MVPNSADLKSPKFWASLAATVLALLLAAGVLSPSKFADVQGPLLETVERLASLAVAVVSLMAAWKQVPPAPPAA